MDTASSEGHGQGRRRGRQPAPRRHRIGFVHVVDAVLCWKWDRFIRKPLDLEYLIPRFDKAGVPDLGPAGRCRHGGPVRGGIACLARLVQRQIPAPGVRPGRGCTRFVLSTP